MSEIKQLPIPRLPVMCEDITHIIKDWHETLVQHTMELNQMIDAINSIPLGVHKSNAKISASPTEE